jgi:hypothetical protein
MKQIVAAVLFVVACGGKQKTDPSLEGKAEGGGTVAAMDTLLAQLEAMRAYVVIKADAPDCAAYTAEATTTLSKVADATAPAASARTATAPDAVAAWQKSHAPAIEKLIAEVATPVRSVTDCPAMEKDETWKKISIAIVAVAQPTTLPAPVVKRREALTELSTVGANISSPADCQKIGQTMQSKFGNLEAEMKQMTPIEQFVDDKVWEEEDEKRAMSDAGLKKLFETCGGEM